MPTNGMRPIHPGEILRCEIEELGIPARGLAAALRVPANRITAIMRERGAIDADMALRLARYFGSTPEFWLNLQSAYDLRHARLRGGRRITKDVRPRAATG